jgi:hypothetical protein
MVSRAALTPVPLGFFGRVGIISGQPSLDNYRTSDFKAQFLIGPRL